MLLWIVPSWAFWLVPLVACAYGAGVWILLIRARRRGERLGSPEIRWTGLGASVVALAAGVVTGGGLLSGAFFAIGALGLLNGATFAILRRKHSQGTSGTSSPAP